MKLANVAEIQEYEDYIDTSEAELDTAEAYAIAKEELRRARTQSERLDWLTEATRLKRRLEAYWRNEVPA